MEREILNKTDRNIYVTQCGYYFKTCTVHRFRSSIGSFAAYVAYGQFIEDLITVTLNCVGFMNIRYHIVTWQGRREDVLYHTMLSIIWIFCYRTNEQVWVALTLHKLKRKTNSGNSWKQFFAVKENKHRPLADDCLLEAPAAETPPPCYCSSSILYNFKPTEWFSHSLTRRRDRQKLVNVSRS